MTTPDLALAADFPPATREMWLDLVERVLKGADFEKRLVSRTADGIRVEPLYPKADAATQPSRAVHGPWRIAQRMDHPDPAMANALALADLSGGADGLTVVFASAPSARGFGLRAETLDALDRALDGVMLDLVQVRLEAGGWGRQAAALLVALAERRGHAPGGLDLDHGLDQIGAFAATGRLSAPWDVVAARSAETVAGLAERGFAGRVFRADGRPVHEAGGSEAQELAFVLATAVTCLRALESGGHGLDRARDALSFTLVADADAFLTIAKLRAFRRLWARVEEACGLAPKPARLHAETAWRMTTRRDPWVNLLRGTLAAFAAGIGGADGITVLPFTAALGLPDAFARRLARNAQLILLEEANLWRVADPTAGAGSFEALTDALAEGAWALFQEIEREGGIVASLSRGALQGRIAAVRAERETGIAQQTIPITGTSAFPDPGEGGVAVLLPSPMAGADPQTAGDQAGAPPMVAAHADQPSTEPPISGFTTLLEAAASGAPPGHPSTAPPGSIAAPPLPSRRDAEGFERLRDRSDAHLARTGARPRVFLANLGPVLAFTARAAFAKAFFEAGGIEVSANDGIAAPAVLSDAFRDSGASIACLCSSDENYASKALAAARALADAGAARVYVAGRPLTGLKGPDSVHVAFIHADCNALEMLAEAQAAAADDERF